MLKKIGFITLIIIILLSIFYLLETENIFGFMELNSQPKYYSVFLTFIILIATFNLLILIRLSSSKPEVIEKVVYKEVLKTEEIEEKIENESDEEIIEKALELSNKILFEARDILDIEKYCDKILVNFAKNFNIVQGLFFLYDKNTQIYKTKGTYAFYSEEAFREFELGVGLTGQVAKNKTFLCINNVPEQYIKIISGLGSSSPNFLTIFPIIYEEQTIGIIEVASFEKISDELEKLFLHVSYEIGNDLFRFLQ